MENQVACKAPSPFRDLGAYDTEEDADAMSMSRRRKKILARNERRQIRREQRREIDLQQRTQRNTPGQQPDSTRFVEPIIDFGGESEAVPPTGPSHRQPIPLPAVDSAGEADDDLEDEIHHPDKAANNLFAAPPVHVRAFVKLSETESFDWVDHRPGRVLKLLEAAKVIDEVRTTDTMDLIHNRLSDEYNSTVDYAHAEARRAGWSSNFYRLSSRKAIFSRARNATHFAHLSSSPSSVPSASRDTESDRANLMFAMSGKERLEKAKLPTREITTPRQPFLAIRKARKAESAQKKAMHLRPMEGQKLVLMAEAREMEGRAEAAKEEAWEGWYGEKLGYGRSRYGAIIGDGSRLPSEWDRIG
jgi:hypothetical protein